MIQLGSVPNCTILQFHHRSVAPVNHASRSGNICELKVREPAPQLLFSAIQAHVALEATGQWQSLKHGLAGIQIAGMNVCHQIVGRLSAPSLEQRIWAKPEVTATRIDNMLSADGFETNRKLLHLHALVFNNPRSRFGVRWHTSVCMSRRKYRTIILDAKL